MLVLIFIVVGLSITNILITMRLKYLGNQLKRLEIALRNQQRCLELVNKVFESDNKSYSAIENLIQMLLSQIGLNLILLSP